MRVALRPTMLPLFGLFALSAALVGCPEKAGAPADKTTAEPERAEPDEEKKPAAAAPAAPAAAPAAADEKKEEKKEEGGW